MGPAEHLKPYSHGLGKVPIKVLPTQGLQPPTRTFNVGDHRSQGLKRSARLPEPCPVSQDSNSKWSAIQQYGKVVKDYVTTGNTEKKKPFKSELRSSQHLSKSLDTCCNWRFRRTQGVHTPSSKSKQRLLSDLKVLEKSTTIAQVISKNVARGYQ